MIISLPSLNRSIGSLSHTGLSIRCPSSPTSISMVHSTEHSTESALLKMFNDILLAVDSGKNTVLLLLDLTAAFDTVDHNILLCRLEHLFGIRGIALQWLNSYIRDRSFSVELGKFSSSVAPIICGVPQGSILGPFLFNLYMRPLGDIIRRHNSCVPIQRLHPSEHGSSEGCG